MEKHYSQNVNMHGKINKKPNIFQRFHSYKMQHDRLSEQLKTVTQKLKSISRGYYDNDNISTINNDYSELLHQREELIKALKKVDENYKALKKKLIKVASITSIGILLAASVAGYNINKNNNNIEDAYGIVSEYDSFDDTYNKYEEAKNINAPEAITKLALDTLKSKIAQSLGIEDPSTILILDNSTYVRADKYHDKTGFISDISIVIGNTTIGEYKSFSSSTNEESISKNSISEAMLNSIRAIVEAQGDENKFSAKKALNAVCSLEKEDLKLPEANKILAENSTGPEFEK